MTKHQTIDELLKSCRYFNLEENNPYPPSPARYCWIVEHNWLYNTLKDRDEEKEADFSHHEAINEYLRAGLSAFEENDEIPISLKASLYKIFQHWNEGMGETKAFQSFYISWRNKELNNDPKKRGADL